MLILRRKSGESIFIGGKIKVSVIEVKGGHVKLGIEAPGQVFVYRGEIFEKIIAENKHAATARINDLDGLALLLDSRKKRNARE